MICIWSSWCHCHMITSCFIKVQIGLTFLVLAYPGCPGKEAVKWVSVLELWLFAFGEPREPVSMCTISCLCMCM